MATRQPEEAESGESSPRALVLLRIERELDQVPYPPSGLDL
jgi:hypothetical protein